MNDLIDTTEMYLRTIYDLEEEGVVPLRTYRRASRAEWTHRQSDRVTHGTRRPHVAGDRHLELTEKAAPLLSP